MERALGSPPHGRGTRLLVHVLQLGHGLTPARAGNTAYTALDYAVE